jgi:hypothetical protein
MKCKTVGAGPLADCNCTYPTCAWKNGTELGGECLAEVLFQHQHVSNGVQSHFVRYKVVHVQGALHLILAANASVLAATSARESRKPLGCSLHDSGLVRDK